MSSEVNWAAEKADLIGQIIELKKSHQILFFRCEELASENKNLKDELFDLKNQNAQLESKSFTENDLARENNKLLAKLSQMKSPVDSKELSVEYEVAKLLKHRGKLGKREFRVRWLNFGTKDDTWEKESNLSCPAILKEYKKKHRLA